MKSLFILSCLLIQCSYGLTSDTLWEQWKSKFAKQYGLQDDLKRRQIWDESVRRIAEHNLKFDLGLVTYTKGLNQFSDMTWEEFKSIYAVKDLAKHLEALKTNVNPQTTEDFLPNVTVPDRVDWREKGWVTKVDFQGQCGSCWTFSVTGVVEGQFKKIKNKLVKFSKQELLDCGRPYHLGGCDGGWPEYAMKYIVDNGLGTERAYRYIGYESVCRRTSTRRLAYGDKFSLSTQGDEQKLVRDIVNIGPISICIEMDQGFRDYKSGVYTSTTCGSDVNHAMLAVGYGKSEEGLDYYIIKNSWGEHWGERGYILYGRNRGDMCGIASHTVYLTLKHAPDNLTNTN